MFKRELQVLNSSPISQSSRGIPPGSDLPKLANEGFWRSLFFSGEGRFPYRFFYFKFSGIQQIL